MFPLTTNILRSFHRKLLPKLEVNRNIPTELIEIPAYMGGFQMKSLEIE